MAADLPDRRDDVFSHLLGDARKLLLGQPMQVLRAVDVVEQPLWGGFAHDVRV